ncbi:apolipoprotein C-IV [Lepisosteus oculatus]|uniref:apolipoprotein C-IV n=1 Tax=Lepisosteus oculatus TaxID=7918 RepID=UPI003721B7ED
MAVKQVTVVLLFLLLQVTLAPAAPQGSAEEPAGGLLQRASEALGYVRGLYADVTDSVATSETWKLLKEMLPDDPLGEASKLPKTITSQVEAVSSAVRGFAEAYYDDHIKDVAQPLVGWASATAVSFWDRLKVQYDQIWTPTPTAAPAST